MSNNSPSVGKVAFVSALFGILSAFVASRFFLFGLFGAIIIGLIVAAIVWFILWRSWGNAGATPAVAAQSTPAAHASDHATTTKPAAAPAVAAAPVAKKVAPVAEEVAKPVVAKAAAKPAAKKPAAKKAAAKPAAAKPAAKKTAAKPAAAKKAAQPEQLKKARAGGADDLKEISGVGPKMEKLLNELGFYHFDQVASWNKKQADWVNDHLDGFKGRIARDEWVKQAKALAKKAAK